MWRERDDEARAAPEGDRGSDRWCRSGRDGNVLHQRRGAAPDTTVTAATAIPPNLKLIRTKTSLLGKHYWYQQTFKGLSVIGGYYAKHIEKAGKLLRIADGREAVPESLSTTAVIASAAAIKSANAVVNAKAARSRIADGKNSTPVATASQGAAQLAVLGGRNARLVWNVTSRSAKGVSRSLVDAKSGSVVESKVISENIDGRARSSTRTRWSV